MPPLERLFQRRFSFLFYLETFQRNTNVAALSQQVEELESAYVGRLNKWNGRPVSMQEQGTPTEEGLLCASVGRQVSIGTFTLLDSILSSICCLPEALQGDYANGASGCDGLGLGATPARPVVVELPATPKIEDRGRRWQAEPKHC